MGVQQHRESILLSYRAARDGVSGQPDEVLARYEAEILDRPDSLAGVLGGLLRSCVDFQQGRYPEAEAGALAARAELYERGEERLVGEAELLLGNIALERGEYDEAARRYTATVSSLDQPADLGRVHNNLGLVAWRLRDLDRAEEHYRRALACFGPKADRRVAGNLLNNLGLVHEDRHELAEAEAQYRAAIVVLEGVDANILANALSNLGELLQRRGEVSEALKLHARALSLRESIGHVRGVVSSRIALAHAALSAGQVDEARAYVEAALPECRKLGLKKQEADLLQLRSELAERVGDLVGALGDVRAAHRLREALFGEQMADRVAALQLSFEARRVELIAVEQRQRQAALAREVDQASEVRWRFLSMLSHELRTPLTGVIGAAELLRSAPMDAEQRRLMEIVSNGGEALLSTINDVLDFSKIEAGKLELASEVFSPRELVQHVVRFVKPQDRPHVTIELELTDAVPAQGWGDRVRLRQILMYLLTNAVRFTRQGVVGVHVDWRDGVLLCEIADAGGGIPPEEHELLFEPYARPMAFARTRGGGLGLAIARRVAHAVGGSVSAVSVQGVGTTFHVVIPFPEANAPVSEPAPLPQVGHRFGVVLIEDDEMVRGVLAELLSVCGADVVAVGAAEEGLAAVDSCNPALVVMDVQMPGMDGVACTRELRARHGAKLRILVVSGATAPREVAAANEAGVDGWLAKPVSLRGLRFELERLGVRRPEP